MGDNGLGQGRVRALAMLGNHLPRHCGIATFTTDLFEAITREAPSLDGFVVAMNDPGARHAYPPRVRFEVADTDREAYAQTAESLNASGVEVVSLQHEYGIFGGAAGAYVLALLRALRMPVVTTLHTILAEPNAQQREVLETLIGLSERVVVMSHDGAALLRAVHGVDAAKIDVIPHGIPVVPPRPARDTHGADGRAVILTFGLLSPDKGIEHVIDAMPAVLARHPRTEYIVLGATHPHVKQHHGEAYRLMLQARAALLGVEGSVIFHNRFVSHDELVEFLGDADLYVTPYLKEEQSTSGTLAYAVGSGKAVISTPYRYARELLGEGRGVLVPWRDADAIARAVTALLDHPARRAALQERAAEFGRAMAWPLVARAYLASFERARASFDARRRASLAARALARRRPALPDVDLAHLRLMTDDTGLLQHATFDVPSYRDGYCIDDNARALLLMTHVEEAGAETARVVRALTARYLAFISYALDPASGRFHNFLSYARQWHDAPGSDDSHGRALWALGVVVGRGADSRRRGLAARLFRDALPAAAGLTSPRAWAYALLGLDAYLSAHDGDRGVEALRDALVARLIERYEHSRRPDWPWFEDRLTYCNARLPQALMVSAARTGDAAAAAVAERSLAWLAGQHVAADGTFSPVGTNGFHVRGDARATFDQQPVEACAMVSACLDAHRITGQARWLDEARRAFQWFLGQNPLHAQVYDAHTGGCRDGIHADRMNENQGAESTLSFLTALSEMRAAERAAARDAPPARDVIARSRQSRAAPEPVGDEALS
jgi:glycosyltransferase involved in cell wall biosynthesis